VTDSETSQPLELCGCCSADARKAGLPTDQPVPGHVNRPGLPAIAYRIGTHGSFMRRMLSRLQQEKIVDGLLAGSRPLNALTTRSTEDPAIALLDAWASVADVLTFYQERIANEGYLCTAAERRSVLELARAIGYELKPGVAASTYLAFTIEDAPGAPGIATIDKGVRVLSIPTQDQKPQTFETVEKIEARLEWNALRPRQTQPQDLTLGAEKLYLKGISTSLQPGDVLLLVGDERESFPGSERWDFRIVKTVTTNPEKGQTLVTWLPGLGERRSPSEHSSLPAENPRVYTFRLRAALFGHSAADWDHLHEDIKKLYASEPYPPEWPGFEIQDRHIDLDASYPKVLKGSWVALVKPSYVELYKANADALHPTVTFTTRTGFGLVSKITRIEPDAYEHLSWFGLRNTTVYAQSEELAIGEEPLALQLTQTSTEKDIPLAGFVPGLVKGRTLIFSGKRMRARLAVNAPPLTLTSPDGLQTVSIQPGDSLLVTTVSPPLVGVRAVPVPVTGGIRWFLQDRDGFAGSAVASGDRLVLEAALKEDALVSEVAVLHSVVETRERTTLTLEDPLKNYFDRTTVTIYANVALATHGETAVEVLGSGDGSRSNQRFTLKKPPLTYVSAATASGVENSLQVRMNGVLWDEEPTLFGLEARSTAYIVRIEDDGRTSLTFGDGKSGSRLPTGMENVVATYRSGIGLAGEVGTGSLSLLQTRPLGVRSVTNPLPASGAADPESRDQARTNAPITVLTLDRIISLRDFEDFARAFAGIGKTQAVALWNGEVNVVHISAATVNGDPVDSNPTLLANLVSAIHSARDPSVPMVVQGFHLERFKVEVKLLVDSRYIFEDVKASVEAMLKDTFSFEKRAFGQPVTSAEIVTAIQQVEGIIAADLDKLYREDQGRSLHSVLTAAAASRVGKVYSPAELLVVHADKDHPSVGITLEKML